MSLPRIWRNQVSVDCEEPVFLCLREDPELPQLWTTDRTLNVVFRRGCVNALSR